MNKFRFIIMLVVFFLPSIAAAQEVVSAGPSADPMAEGVTQMAEEVRDMPVASTVRMIMIRTALTFVPAVLLVMTPFTRFIIVFSMLRQALGLQQAPPNQVLIGLALFMAALVMGPTLEEVNTTAVQPYMAGEMETSDAIELGMQPMRRFMLSNTRRDDISAVMNMGRISPPETLDDIPSSAVVSAFILSELKTAFVIAVKVYLPFLVIDIVIANVLLSMGMMVLPPVIISLPFKLMLFILMDGWNLLVRSMAAGFGGV
jgi:flagellar biosynthetic protein FliP